MKTLTTMITPITMETIPPTNEFAIINHQIRQCYHSLNTLFFYKIRKQNNNMAEKTIQELMEQFKKTGRPIIVRNGIQVGWGAKERR
jgi:hypothetical protein